MIRSLLVLMLSLTPLVAQAALTLSRPVIYELDDRSADLTLIDLDDDGRLDLLAANNAEGTIDLLYGRETRLPDSEDENELELHTRGELITGRVMDDIAVGDLDGDGLSDVVVGSERSGAAVFFQTEPRTFETARRLRAPARWVLVTDWDGDQRQEVLAIDASDRPATLTCLRANGDREMRPLWSTALSTPPGDTPRLMDWDGDGDDDLLWAPADPTRVHVLENSGAEGAGAEQIVRIGQAVDWAPLRTDGRVELAAIERASGTLRLLEPSRSEPAERNPVFGAPRHVALPHSDGSGRVTPLIGPFGEGGRDALYVPPRESAEALVIRAGAGRTVQRLMVPALNEVDSAQALPDGTLLLLSQSEGIVGTAPRPEAGAAPAQPLPLEIDPLAAAWGQLDADPEPEVLVLGRNTEGTLVARLLSLGAEDAISDSSELALPDLPDDDPLAIRPVDVNGDDRQDLLFFYTYRSPIAYLQTEDGAWQPLSGSFQVPSAFLEGVNANQIWVGSLEDDGPPMTILARGPLVRVLSFSEPPQVQVSAQISAPRPGADFTAVTAIPGTNSQPPAILAVDRSESVVLVWTQDAEGWALATEVDLDLQSPQWLGSGDWDGDGLADLAIKGANALSLVFGGLTSPPLEQLATRKSPLEDGRLALVDTLSWDGNPPWIHTIDHRHDTLLISSWDPNTEDWEDIWRFRVFETPGDRRRDWERDLSSLEVEPREMAVGDVDGDGHDDLVMLAHNHLLIYLWRSPEDN